MDSKTNDQQMDRAPETVTVPAEPRFEDWYERLRRERGVPIGPLESLSDDALQMLLAAYFDKDRAVCQKCADEPEPVAWGWLDPLRPDVGFRVLTPHGESAAVDVWRHAFACAGQTSPPGGIVKLYASSEDTTDGR